MDISSKVISVLAERYGYDLKEITNDTTFHELALDSLDVAEIVMGFENTFNIMIDITKTKGTVGELINAIETMRKK